MRKKINGRIYDTKTAKLVAVHFNEGLARLQSSYNTRFYEKRNGETFYIYNGEIYTDEIDRKFFVKDVYKEMITDRPHFIDEMPISSYEIVPFSVMLTYEHVFQY
jgi:hypothetical protein